MRKRTHRIYQALLVGAVLALLVSSLYGIAAPFVAGHYGFHGGDYANRARNTIRHGIIMPANWMSQSRPGPETYYLHHPILTHELVTLSFLVLGEHEYSIRAASILTYLLALLALALLIRRLYGPLQAALAAWVYVLLPVDVWFGINFDTRFPAFACILLFFLYYFRWLDQGRWRDAWLASFFMVLAGFFDWIPYLYAVPVFVHAAGVGLRRGGRHLAFVPLLAMAVVSPMILHVIFVIKTGHLEEMRTSYGVRSATMDTRYFVMTMEGYARVLFGPVMYLAIHAWALLLLCRALLGRLHRRHLLGITFLLGFVVYLRLFRQGCVVHMYVMLYGTLVCAMAAVDLSEAVRSALDGIAPRLRLPRWVPAVGTVAFSIGLVGAMLPGAAAALIESRDSAGNPPPNQAAHAPFNLETDKVAFVDRVRLSTTTQDVVYMHPTFRIRNDMAFNLDRDAKLIYSLSQAKALPAVAQKHAVVLLTLTALDAGQRRELGLLGREHPLYLLDGYCMLDLRRQGASIVVEKPRTVPRQRGWLSRFLVGPHPLPMLVEDPAAEAALRAEMGQAR